MPSPCALIPVLAALLVPFVRMAQATSHAAPSHKRHLHRGAFLTIQSTSAASGGERNAEMQMEMVAWRDALLDAKEVNNVAGSLLTNAALRQIGSLHGGPTEKLRGNANKTALKAELGLLKNLFARLKRGIVSSKKQEDKDKERQQQTLQVLQDRLKTAEKDLAAAQKAPKTTDFRMSLLKDRVVTLKRSVAYWKEERETSHVEFHASLKQLMV